MCFCNVYTDGTIQYTTYPDTIFSCDHIQIFIRNFLPTKVARSSRANPTTVDHICTTHQHSRTLTINIKSDSLQSLNILAAFVASLPSITYVKLAICCADIPPILFDVSFVARALAYNSVSPSDTTIIRQFARYATHVRTSTDCLIGTAIRDCFPSLISLSLTIGDPVSHHIQPIINQLPLLEGLFIPACRTNPLHITLSHPNIRYLHPDIILLPNSHLPRLSPIRATNTPTRFCPATSYLDNPIFNLVGTTLGDILASFLLSVHRHISDIDPLVVTSIFTHLTNRDGIRGPETLDRIYAT